MASGKCCWFLSLSLIRFAPMSQICWVLCHWHFCAIRQISCRIICFIYNVTYEPETTLGRVDAPLSRHAPLRIGHAAFPHPALHMADLLSNLCVFNTFLLKSCFLTFPISKYCASYFPGYCHMWLPFLPWHYPRSSVLWSHPTAYTSFAALLLVE